MTMRSGTNQYHGSGYDYFVNEALNAGQAFTVSPNGGHLRPVQRRNDYGFTLGGAVWIPKVYNGHDKTFFFFNFEQFLESQTVNTMALTVPTQAYRDGNFANASTGRVLATDPIGRTIIEGTIYDPGTQKLAPNGQTIRDPFANNKIPLTQQDPVALKIQALIPAATLPGFTNNGIYPWVSDRVTTIPAVKLDHSLSAKAKLSIYSSETRTNATRPPGNAGNDGLPLTITGGKDNGIYSYTHRVNFDYSLSPTTLLHMGAGYTDNDFYNTAAVLNFDAAAQLGLKGAPSAIGQFPTFTGLTAARGGMVQMGPGAQSNPYMGKPTAVTSITVVRNNHTYKAGAEMRLESYIGRIYTNRTGAFSFSADQTGLPSTQSQNLSGGTVGFPYASFLLGAVNTQAATDPAIFRLGKHQWGFFAQDTWKVTRRFTLDYGLRYDYSTHLREQYGRMLNFSPVTPNPSAGGILGATIFEGTAPGRCGCDFAQDYPLALAPRLGMAYQINSKTVLRAGFGVVYGNTEDANGAANTLPISGAVGAAGFGDAVTTLQNGITIPRSQFKWPNFDPGQYPQGSSLTAPPIAIDQNAGRPPRQVQWSVGVQREIFRDLVLETSYVANRGVWWNSPGLVDINALTPERLALFGLDVSKPADQTLLSARLDSTTAAQRNFNKGLPYAGYPLGATVAQSLRPFPQFGTITRWWSPLGKTWYDSLQVKATKRFSHGLSFTSVFTWQKNLVLGSANAVTAGTGGTSATDVFNRPLLKSLAASDQPLVFNAALTYTLPRLHINRVLSSALGDWTIGAFFAYGSGTPIAVPTSQNKLSSSLFRSTVANRVPGQPIFTQDLNCHCFDPNKTFVLNPNAWSDPVAGQWGNSALYYGDYRTNRRPQENFNFGRNFRMTEKVVLNIRGEFTNVFNRASLNSPTSTNSLATQTRDAFGQTTGGFGWINTSSLATDPRSGVLIARITF